jgi:RNA polymerase sigma-70 factor (ECF subfamily)
MERLREAGDRGDRGLVTPELLDSCEKGDEAAWSRLVEATYREVYGLCLRILNDPDDAAEATQDAYLKAWRGLSGFRGDAMFSTWLYRVAANAAITKLRVRKRKRSHETELEEEALTQLAGPSSTQASALAKLDLEELERALRSLPEHYRAVLVLRDVYGLSIEEIARELRISETATKVRIHRGRKKVRDLMFEDAHD